MPRLVRQPLVALLAALAALLAAPLGATAAGSVAVAARQAVAGATQTTSQAPVGRVTTGRELRDTAARRVQHGGTEVGGAVASGAERAGHRGPGHVPAGAVAGVLLALALGWWARRSVPAQVPAGRTSRSRCGRGPPALACA
jgi:hypothetical protein